MTIGIEKVERIEKLAINAGYRKNLRMEDFQGYQERFSEFEKKEQKAIQKLESGGFLLSDDGFPVNFLKRTLWVRTNKEFALVAYFFDLNLHGGLPVVRSKKKLNFIRIKLGANFIDRFIKGVINSMNLFNYNSNQLEDWLIFGSIWSMPFVSLMVAMLTSVHIEKVLFNTFGYGCCLGIFLLPPFSTILFLRRNHGRVLLFRLFLSSLFR